MQTRDLKIRRHNFSEGFTLVEVLVVAAIIALLSTILILNFGTLSQGKTARTQTASVIVSDIRRAQSMALAGTRLNGNLVCGYGVHYVNADSYLIYAGADEGVSCINTNHNYQVGVDYVVEQRALANTKTEIRSLFSDIFFEPPDPKTYINNSSSLIASPSTIQIQRKGEPVCNAQVCTQIDVYTSGRIDLN